MDQPSIDGLNTWAISKAVRARGITVALSGAGGDELFGGYSHFARVPALMLAAPLLRSAPASLRRKAVEWAGAGWPSARRRKAADFAVAVPNPRTYALLCRRLLADSQMEALGLGVLSGTDYLPSESLAEIPEYARSAWATVRGVEARRYLADTLLRDADVFGMACSLEIRVPLLDRRVAEIALSYAPPALAGGWSRQNKPWLVEAVGEETVRAVARMPKRGFTLPVAKWMTGPLRTLCEERALDDNGLVPRSAAMAAWNELTETRTAQAGSRALAFVALSETVARIRRAVVEAWHARRQ
jgi:asparagine synthase (glutamine-hydrolysing)